MRLLVLLLSLAAVSGWSFSLPSALGDPPVEEVWDDLEEAREEVRLGRHWHAAEILRSPAMRDSLGPSGMLLLAEAQAGYRNWAGVVEILEGAEWVEAVSPARSAYLLGRAYEAQGRAAAAADSYRRAATLGGFDFDVHVRLARALQDESGAGSSLPVVDVVAARDSAVGGMLAWELLRDAAAAGDSAGVAGLLSRVVDPEMRRRSRDAYARAVLAAGDSARALELYRDLLGGSSGASAADHGHTVGTLLLADGDTAAAASAFLSAFEAAPRSRSGMRAARHVVDLVPLTYGLALSTAGALDRLGDGRRALAAYDTYVELASEAGEEIRVGARVERARLLSTVPGRVDEAVEEFRALDEHPDPAVGARVLDLWTDLRRRQGQTGNVRVLRRWLVERYPDTDQAAEVVFLRGDFAQDLGDWDRALSEYGEVTRMAPARRLAGLARMRMGQIHLSRGDVRKAAETYRDYLESFPTGRRWAEASFWAGRSLDLSGDPTAAEPFYRRVLEGDPYSYYGALAARALDVPYPSGLEPVPAVSDAPWVEADLARLDLLEAAGLTASAELHLDRMQDRAGRDGPSARYPLAEGLIERGRTIEGINQGWALRRDGESWNPRLLRVLYPYPNREMVEREAEEWGVDPFLMAALIRQESAWDRDIVSSAGAIGLMQVMPATGRQLARSVGPESFSTESLESAEVNLHLGARFLRDMLDRFGPGLPLVLSAYNAGPTRANRWQAFPEHGDELRFTERIPFTETRGYVKNVTRNADLYRALYGDGDDTASP